MRKIIVIAIVIAAMFIGGCAKDAAVVEEPTATPVAVEVVEAE